MIYKLNYIFYSVIILIGGYMKSIIPFKKDIIFKTKLGEITSISVKGGVGWFNSIPDCKEFINNNVSLILNDYGKCLCRYLWKVRKW